MPSVAVIGLGRIGLPLAISFADRGLSVLGVDKDADRLRAVRDARMPFEEPGPPDAAGRGAAARPPRGPRPRAPGAATAAAGLGAVRGARMPPEAPGAQDALDRVHAAGTLTVSDSVAD